MGQRRDSATKCYELIEVRPLEGDWSGGRKKIRRGNYLISFDRYWAKVIRSGKQELVQG